MEEYRIDIKVRNNLILSRIEELGFKSPRQFCLNSPITYGSLMKFLNMKRSIYDTKGRVLPFVKKLCDVLKCIPEELFSANQMEAFLKDNKRSIQMGEAEVVFMLGQADNQKLLEDHYMEEKRSIKIDEALKTLPIRLRKVLEMRMGLGEYGREHTFEEISKVMDVTRERVRQMEAKAIRYLKGWRAGKLREFIEDNE